MNESESEEDEEKSEDHEDEDEEDYEGEPGWGAQMSGDFLAVRAIYGMKTYCHYAVLIQ